MAGEGSPAGQGRGGELWLFVFGFSFGKETSARVLLRHARFHLQAAMLTHPAVAFVGEVFYLYHSGPGVWVRGQSEFFTGS